MLKDVMEQYANKQNEILQYKAGVKIILKAKCQNQGMKFKTELIAFYNFGWSARKL